MPGKPVFGALLAFALAVTASYTPPARAGTHDQTTVDPFIFGGSKAYPPYQWLDEEGRARGFLIDLQVALGEAGGRPVTHRLMPWNRALEALDAGAVDAVPMFASPERARRYDFTDPFFYVTHAVFGPEDYPGVEGPEALRGHRVAVVNGGYAESLLKARTPGARLLSLADIEAAVRAVADDRADFAVVARPIAARLTTELGLPVRQISRPIWPRAYVFAVREGDTESLHWLQTNLRRVQASGRYHAIYGSWRDELEWHPTTWRDLLAPAVWIAAPALFLLLGVLGWNHALRRRVVRHTAALDAELSRRRQVEASLIHAASHDPLTDLPNRGEFKYRLTEQLGAREDVSPEPLGVIAVSLDDLAEITSAFGYETGEDVVRHFADRLRTAGADAVGDFGRGRFCLLWTSPEEETGLLARLSNPLLVNELEVDPRLSVAVAWRTAAREDAEELIRRAETALARAEFHTGGWTRYQPEMEPDPQDLLLIRDFRRHFQPTAQVVYQPQFNPRSRRFVGAEALFRWTHPELGPISPGRLIPLLDKANLTPRVTDFVLDAAIETAVRLRAAGQPLRISINISGSDFVLDRLSARIGERLDRLGGNPSDLCLEITETSLITDPDQVSRELQTLSGMGVSCAIDDFGTGYSSLSYLGHFPLDEVKIDMSFVQRMTTDDRHLSIVRSSIALARELGLRTVAEGAEDAATVQALLDAGCELIQGFYYARPVPVEELATLVGPDSPHAAASERRHEPG